jgi:aminomethyltransferase
MTHPASGTLKKTPLHGRHRALGARMVEFGGWDMPVEYSGIADEHMAVRSRAGLFDVSHMGEIEIAGGDALAAVQRITSNDASRLARNQAQYSALTTPEGTFVDDVLTYRLADDHFMLVVNASNIIKDFTWISRQLADAGDAAVVNTSSRYALLALQGPAAREVLQTLTGVNLSEIKYYWFTTGEIASVRATISRTGYTGEDGFEVFVPPASAERVWDAILQAGRGAGVVPAGLGARDTLRLEAGMRLYGNDMDETTSVLEADLGWIVGWKKDAFIGADVLKRQKLEGVRRKLVGFEVLDRAIGRHGYDVLVEGEKAGVVTSGTQTPFLKKAIGMAYVPAERSAPGTEIAIDVRGRSAKARVVPMPFYKRAA